jgi:hypothetical protein
MIFKNHDYAHDEYYDCYLSPAGETLKYSTTTNEGYREYKSPKHIVANLPFLGKMYGKQGSS